MTTVSALPGDPFAITDNRVFPYTRAFVWVLRIGFALVPSAAIAYLYFAGNPALRFIDHGFHEIAIGVAISLGAFVSYVTWRCYRSSGEPFLYWVAQGMTGFTLVYLPHGVLTRTADHHLLRFLLYGPASRIVMVTCLLLGLLRYGALPDSLEKRHNLGPIWRGVLLFALIDLVVAVAADNPATYGIWLRLVAENGTIALALTCIAIIFLRGISTPLMLLYVLAMAFFAQSSVSFMLAKPWDHQWWLAHAIFAGGFFILSYGILQAFHTTRAFASVYSQEEMMRRLEEVNADLERLAATDALTGAASRRYFLNRLHEERAKAERTLEPLSLLMMDIDHFKVVNDKYGHQIGDAALVSFVERMRNLLRVPDVLGRLGGEEFCALLVGSSLTQATTIAERIRAAVEAGSIDLDHGELHITVSIGVAEFGPDGGSIEAVIRAADDRLYQAKAQGRNCVVS